MLKKSRANFLSTCAIMFATIFVAMMLDRIISLGLPSGISTAVCVTLTTFSFCFVLNKWHFGVMTGVFFGLSSWIKGFIFGEIYNVNPLVPIPARILSAVAAFATYKFLLYLLKNGKSIYGRQIFAISAATLVGLVANTILYLTALNIYKDFLGDEYDSLFKIIQIVLYTNILPEYLIAIAFAPHIVLGVRRGLRLGLEANLP